ncbi:adenylate cyclase [Pedobacter sp. KBW06]|uniref:class IV adenylate cyclase n=1 Tax=Pedobacter sp. KBW06 TaxID=2153359 RepID=UPI000F5996AE|nr:CYTH domain-containing protein [Pedobacter sp. KBW06]RQO75656.1 adenylate cyclase [Pedobacter sp. KBW06]
MNTKIFEFRIQVKNLDPHEAKLLTLSPYFVGAEHQTDTYFNVPFGQLKLRDTNCTSELIQYKKDRVKHIKESSIVVPTYKPSLALKEILQSQFGVKSVVKKMRRVYLKDNVIFHFDAVEELGKFIKVEATGINDKYTHEDLKQHCEKYLTFFGFHKVNSDGLNLIEKSYSELIDEKQRK